jgi:hypothetical protein
MAACFGVDDTDEEEAGARWPVEQKYSKASECRVLWLRA